MDICRCARLIYSLIIGTVTNLQPALASFTCAGVFLPGTGDYEY
jgi:hypothetical protein